eukprot:scaffold115438_cov23-Tisochrysis_lutea.AAC.1
MREGGREAEARDGPASTEAVCTNGRTVPGRRAEEEGALAERGETGRGIGESEELRSRTAAGERDDDRAEEGIGGASGEI